MGYDDYREKSTTPPSSFLTELSSKLANDSYWQSYLSKFQNAQLALHLAIFWEPYLSLLLEGKKTIESRFSVNRQAPYEQIDEGDIILLKRPSGPIIGLCQVKDVWFYRLDKKSWHTIKNDFFKEIYVNDQQFWDNRKDASYATLIRVNYARSITSINYPKRDRRGWVVLVPRNHDSKLIP